MSDTMTAEQLRAAILESDKRIKELTKQMYADHAKNILTAFEACGVKVIRAIDCEDPVLVLDGCISDTDFVHMDDFAEQVGFSWLILPDGLEVEG